MNVPTLDRYITMRPGGGRARPRTRGSGAGAGGLQASGDMG